jgi:hypothetical protein
MSANKRRRYGESRQDSSQGERVGDEAAGPADDCELHDVDDDQGEALTVAAVGQGAGYPGWWPAGMRNGSPGRGLMLSRLVDGAGKARQLEAAMVQDVADARALGASWQHVGLALGISAEGARSRYGRPGRPAAGGDVESG